MISLFLNTFSSYLNVALMENDKAIKEINNFLAKDLSKEALPSIKKLFDETGYKPSDVDRIVCVSGPGSFTGLRVGVTIAKTYAWSLNKPLYSVSSLFVMASSVKNSDYIIPLIDARRSFVYAAIYDKNYDIVMDECYIGINKLKEIASKLDGKVTYVSLDQFDDLEIVKFIPNLDNTFKCNKFKEENAFTFIPNYLKKTQAEENLNND